MHCQILLLGLLFSSLIQAQTYVTKDIKWFGAKGDGKTNDQAAFEKAAAFFNKRGGNGKLVISKGVYIVGWQLKTTGNGSDFNWKGQDVLHFTNVSNLKIAGSPGNIIRYTPSLKYGSFDPATGKPHQAVGYFVNLAYAASIGHCIFIDASDGVTVSNIELDGNNSKVELGGTYGDVGRQLPHYGIFIQNSRSVKISNVNLHHFALDGICVANKVSNKKDDILISNSRFEYNSRQGFSWIGGNDLEVKACLFNHTGQGNFHSAPGAGVDVEAEVGPVRNGKFENCEFIDNKGCGLVADSGNSADCSFDNCTFWGVDNWSVWVAKPGFTFTNCNIYGSIVHGYDSPNDKDATKYISCHFEDKAYNGKEPYGGYLVETNGMRRVAFTNCTFVSNKKKLMWIFIPATTKPEEKYQFTGCRFTMNNTNLPKGDFIAVIRGLRYKNCVFKFTTKEAKEKGWYLNDCCEPYNVDAGGNKIIYAIK